MLHPDGVPRIVYTSVPADNSRIFSQVMATPDNHDLLSWTQQVTGPLLDLATHDGPNFRGDWRDPYVFQTEGRTFMILGAVLDEEATIAIYENTDGQLQEWTYRGILIRQPLSETKFLECPSIIQINGHWVLCYAPCRQVEWQIGTLDLQNYTFQAAQSGRLDANRKCYACQTKIGPDGRALVFNWVRDFPQNQGWNGCFGVIRHLRVDENLRLMSAPIGEIAKLQDEKISYPAKTLTPAAHHLIMPGEGSSQGQLSLKLSDDALLQIDLCGITVVIDQNGVRFNDEAVSPLPSLTQINFRWLLDRSLLELFVNDCSTYTMVVAYPSANQLLLKTSRGRVQLEDSHAWSMRSVTTQPWNSND